MIEREKVVNGLREMSCRATWKDIDRIRHKFQPIINDAIALLKEQEPIAPKLIKMYPHDIYECGNCKHRSVGSKDYKAKYCPECGRKVKWDAAD